MESAPAADEIDLCAALRTAGRPGGLTPYPWVDVDVRERTVPAACQAGTLPVRCGISRAHSDLGVEVVVLGAANDVDVVHCIRVDGSAGSDHDIFMEDCPRGLAEGGSMRDDRPCPDPRFAPVDFEVSSLAESMSSCQAGPAGTEEGQAGSGRTGIIDAPTGDVPSRDFDRGAWMS